MGKEAIRNVAKEADGKFVHLPDKLENLVRAGTRKDLLEAVEKLGFTVIKTGITEIQGVPFCYTAENIFINGNGLVRLVG